MKIGCLPFVIVVTLLLLLVACTTDRLLVAATASKPDDAPAPPDNNPQPGDNGQIGSQAGGSSPGPSRSSISSPIPIPFMDKTKGYNGFATLELNGTVELVEKCASRSQPVIVNSPWKDDQNKFLSSNVGMNVKCSPDPSQFILIEVDTTVDVVSDGTCESVFKCSFVQAGNTICGSEKPTHIEGIGKEVNRGDAVWTEDSSCQIDVNEGTHSIHNRFINKKAGEGKYYQLPRTVYPILVSEKDVNDRVTQQIGAVEDGEIKRCEPVCDNGKKIIIEHPLEKPAISYMLYVKSTCDWIRICFAPKLVANNKPDTCDGLNEMIIYPKSGIVQPMGERRGVVMRFFGKNPQNQEDLKDHFVQMRVDSTTGIPIVSVANRQQVSIKCDMANLASTLVRLLLSILASSSFIISKSFPMVASHYSVSGGDIALTKKTIFMFSDPLQCLVEKFGIYPEGAIQTSKCTNCTVTPYSVVTISPDKSSTYASTVPPPVTPGVATTPDVRQGGKSVTKSPPDLNHVDSRSLNPTSDLYGNPYADETGWLSWAAYAGFITGMVVAMGLTLLILYLCRRSCFSYWYKGMYKRYQCDPSGVTGGVTGAAFDGTDTTKTLQTVHGNTSTGGTTVGNTTIGTSTRSLTSMTTGATTGGDTTTNTLTM